ncbi:DUF6789 family protein [Streptomyces sp. NPDC057445]|uniref:DUF6789 family protein n=1 Tax=Streptomyces sp. NPDC057445 TaxID=3346136 RepID=UPI0036CEE115
MLTLLAAGSSIAALLLYAAGVFGMPYSVSFLTAPGVVLLVSMAAWARRSRRALLLNRIIVGTVAGLLATAAYDIGRWVIVMLSGVAFDPFGPIVSFGVLITGQPPTSPSAIAAGWAYHLSNGLTFGIAYALIAGPARWWWGVAWGMMLEFATLAVYPVLFSIPAYEPFLYISLVGHFLYGAGLGLYCQRFAMKGR